MGAIIGSRQGRHQEGPGRLHDEPDRLHVPGRRPRAGRLRRSRSSTCSPTASSRPLLFLGAGSVMHGMDDQVNMRRYGAPAQVHGPHLGRVRASATWRSSASRRSPGSSARTRSSTPPGPSTRCPGWRRLIGAGVTGFYMTRMMAMTFYGKARWEDGVHPHESSPVMTVPMIILAVGAVVGGFMMLYVGDIEEWLAPVVGFEEAEGGLPTPVMIALTLTVVAVGVVIGWRQYAMRDVPEVGPDAGLGAHGRRAQRPLRRCGQRGGVHAPRPAPDPHAGLDRQQDHRWGGERHRRRHRRAQRADAPLADRATCGPTP